MKQNLEALVSRAKKIAMTPMQETEQRRSFVYGNTHIENSLITREMVEQIDKRMATEKKK